MVFPGAQLLFLYKLSVATESSMEEFILSADVLAEAFQGLGDQAPAGDVQPYQSNPSQFYKLQQLGLSRAEIRELVRGNPPLQR